MVNEKDLFVLKYWANGYGVDALDIEEARKSKFGSELELNLDAGTWSFRQATRKIGEGNYPLGHQNAERDDLIIGVYNRNSIDNLNQAMIDSTKASKNDGLY